MVEAESFLYWWGWTEFQTGQQEGDFDFRHGDYGDGHSSVGVYEGFWEMECVVVLWRAVALD